MQAQQIDQTVAKLKSLPPERIAEVADFIDFLSQRHVPESSRADASQAPLDFPVDQIDQWPADLSLRREELYGDDGR